MSTTDYLPPDEMSLDAAGDVLGGYLDVNERGETQLDRTFYDTFDGLLYSAGLSVVHERGRLALVDRVAGVERASAPMSPPTAPLLAMSLERCALRDELLPIVDVRALLPLVHVHSHIRAIDVLDGERKIVVRLTLEQPTVVASSATHVPLRPRVRLAAVRGYDEELDAVRDALQGELGWKAADQPLVDEAVRAAGGIPGGIPSKIDVPLSPDQRADAAAATVLGRLLEVIEANVEGTIADIDSEFLHDFRVSVRRSRSVQRELKGVFPVEELARMRIEFRWLQQITGDSRDLDVYVLEFEAMREIVPASMRTDLDPLLTVLRNRRLIARGEMVRALRSERAAAVRRDWAVLLDQLVQLPTDDRPAATTPIGELAGERIRKVYSRMVKMGSAIDGSSPPEDYHELRKKGKELRYLLELFGAPLYPGEVVKPMIKALKALQDVLGRHQDREVQVAMLRSLRDEVSALPGGPAALMAMGVLVDRLLVDEQAARDEFAARFAVFASKSERQTVRDTFA
ncbi:MAG TPA: CHAD domain-containing protein [Solirubrobacteraceae bacterium]|nr:CHAD domain-containing protein [Solirubrobacteraceae bacterium]